MRCFRALFLVVFALVLGSLCFAADVAPPELGDVAATATAAPAPAVQPAGILAQVWTFVNSPAGLAAIGSIVAWILARVFTAKPEWRVVYDKYHPILVSLVKQAEKAIPDTTANAGLARADWVLKKIIEMEPALTAVPPTVVQAAIAAVHADAEVNGNI